MATKLPRKTAAERQAEVKALTEFLHQQVAALLDDDQWKAMLRTSAKFHHYSPTNQLLLWAQALKRGIPLSRVAGFQAWKKMGRSVRKGEKGLQILAPMPWAQRDAEGNVERDGEGREIRGIRFTITHVWDVSQTDGEPLPAVPTGPSLANLGDDVIGLWDALAELVEAQGFTVRRGELPTGTEGETRYEAREVTIASHLHGAQASVVLAHELGHIMAGHETRRELQGVSRAQREAEAESIAYVVCAAVGLDNVEFSAFYVAGWAGGDAKVVQAAAERVNATAREILAALDEKLAPADSAELVSV